jgi:magnesium-transporting ATPase (P-type)
MAAQQQKIDGGRHRQGAADIILLETSLLVVADGVLEGRKVLSNIRADGAR